LWLLVALVSPAAAFSLFGPVGNGGDSYQIPSLTYGAIPACMGGGFVGAPKNLGEEYRWNIPRLYYACDQNFLDYFGSNGLVAIDQVFVILSNHLSARSLTSWSSNLTEFPLDASRVNYRAEALAVFDMRSLALGAMVENLGLANPDEWTWALRYRFLPSGAACPRYDYTVIQRNFDPASWNPTKYVNGNLFTYYVFQGACSSCDNADAVEVLVDPLASYSTAVASWVTGLGAGQIYTRLTRDDMGGFRYLMTTNNANVESLGAGTTILSGGFTNTAVVQSLTSQDLAVFLQQAQTNNPNALRALYPGLQIDTFLTYLTNIYTTNVVSGFLPGFAGASQVITNGTVVYPISTLDLVALLSASITNDAGTLAGLFPGLVVTGETTNYVIGTNFTVTPYFYVPPFSTPPFIPVVGFTTNYTYFFATNYLHTFGNVVTNSIGYHSYLTTITTRDSAPWAVPGLITTNTTTQTVLTTNLAGDFYLLPTNVCGYSVLNTTPPNVIPATNVLSQASTNNGNFFSRISVTYFTNHQLLVSPVTCLVFNTNSTPTSVQMYSYAFNNVITNTFSSNSLVTILTTNLSTGLVTMTTNVVQTNVPSGSFFIVPTNQCGLSIIGPLSQQVVSATNPPTITYSNGMQISQSIITYATNYTVRINPVECAAPGFSGTVALRQGINQMFFQRHDYDSLLGQFYVPVTNDYQSIAIQNSQIIRQTIRRIVNGQPDILFTAEDVPFANANIGNFLLRTTVNFDESNVLPNLAGPGTRTTQVRVTFNKVGAFLINLGPSFLTEANALTGFLWGSFDATTNAPIIYPVGSSIMQLENQLLIQFNTSSLPNAQVGVAYGAALGGSGGSQPYTWTVSVNSASGLPGGLALNPNTGVISGTPAAGQNGVYDITFELTDNGGRTVAQTLVLTVNP
jgi:hypothetical protein